MPPKPCGCRRAAIIACCAWPARWPISTAPTRSAGCISAEALSYRALAEDVAARPDLSKRRCKTVCNDAQRFALTDDPVNPPVTSFLYDSGTIQCRRGDCFHVSSVSCCVSRFWFRSFRCWLRRRARRWRIDLPALSPASRSARYRSRSRRALASRAPCQLHRRSRAQPRCGCRLVDSAETADFAVIDDIDDSDGERLRRQTRTQVLVTISAVHRCTAPVIYLSHGRPRRLPDLRKVENIQRARGCGADRRRHRRHHRLLAACSRPLQNLH